MRMLARRFACVRTTPFGVPVDPDVYWRKAMSSRGTDGSRHREAPRAAAGIVSPVGSHLGARRPGASPKTASDIEQITELVSTTVAPASATIASRRGFRVARPI